MERDNVKPGCYAVIFSSQKGENLEGYKTMDEKTMELAQQTKGYIGYENVGDGKIHSIFISYWETEESIATWRKNATHLVAKQFGRELWYKWFHSMICKVESSNFKATDG